ncbi:MAG: MgtC/SapB family protein [Patescibacteria group bacterium]|nr:MgtC/SapB family protein [Patescibacteria group bacterium]
MDLSLLQQIGTAVMLATLLGLQRESISLKNRRLSFAGIRTFALIGLLGALSSIVAAYSPALAILIAGSLLLIVVAAYVITAVMLKGIGATTEIAAIIAFINGVLCANEQYILATAITLIVLGALHFKGKLHSIAKEIKKNELISAVEFIIIAFIILPILPNEWYGPLEFFNPYVVWLMVVLVSGISFVSYVIVKLIGVKRQIGITGFIAGIVSSTALVVNYSQQSKENPKIINPYVFAVVVGTVASYFRVLLQVSAINRDLMYPLLIPMASMIVIGALGAFFFWNRSDTNRRKVVEEAVKLKSPFKLKPALEFGFFFAVVLLFSKIMQTYFGTNGIYLASVFSSFTGINAITVSMANLAKTDITNVVAVTAITVAAMTNTVVKALVFGFFGNRAVTKWVALIFAGMFVAGGVSLLFV